MCGRVDPHCATVLPSLGPALSCAATEPAHASYGEMAGRHRSRLHVPLASPLPPLELCTPLVQPIECSRSSTPSVRSEGGLRFAVAPAGHATLGLFSVRTAWQQWTRRHPWVRSRPRSSLLACRASEARLRAAFNLLRAAPHAATLQDRARSLRRAWHLWLTDRSVVYLRTWLSLRSIEDTTASLPTLPWANPLDNPAVLREARPENAAVGDAGWGAEVEAAVAEFGQPGLDTVRGDVSAESQSSSHAEPGESWPHRRPGQDAVAAERDTACRHPGWGRGVRLSSQPQLPQSRLSEPLQPPPRKTKGATEVPPHSWPQEGLRPQLRHAHLVATTVAVTPSEKSGRARACSEWARHAAAFSEHPAASSPSVAPSEAPPFGRPTRPTVGPHSRPAAVQSPVSRVRVTPPRYPCMRGGVPPAGRSLLESAVLTLRHLEPRFVAPDAGLEAATRMARLRRGWRRWLPLREAREAAGRLGRLGGRWGLFGKRLRLQRAWVGWARHSASMRQAERIVSARRVRLKEEWSGWLASLQEPRRAHRLSAAARGWRLHSVLKRWASRLAWHGRRHSLWLCGRSLLLSLRLRAWRAGADGRRHTQCLLVRAQRVDSRLARAWRCFRIGIQRKAHCRRVRVHGLRSAAHSGLSRAWLSWQSRSVERRRLSLRLITPWTQCALFFERWSLALKASCELVARFDVVLGRRRQFAFARWRCEAAEQQRLVACSLPLRTSVPRSAFGEWLRYAHQSTARQLLGSLALRCRVHVSWQLWRALASARARLYPARIPILTNRILVAFERWLAHSESALLEQRLLTLLVLSKLHSAWRHWRRQASEHARLSQRLGRVLTSSLVAAIEQWSSYSDRLLDKHRLAALVARRRCEAAWQHWRGYMSERALISQCHALAWSCADSFARWRVHSHTSLAEDRLGRVTVRRKQVAAWQQWSTYARERACLYRHVLPKRTALLNTSFARWVADSDTLLKEARLRLLIVQSRQQAALRHWLELVRELTRLLQLVTCVKATFIPAAFEQWVKASAGSAHLRYVGNKARLRFAWHTWSIHRRCARRSAAVQDIAIVALVRTRWLQWQGSLLSIWQRMKMRWLCDEARLRARWRSWRRRFAQAWRLASRWKAPRLRRACEKWRVHAALVRRACIEALRANRHRLRRQELGFPSEHARTEVDRVLKQWRSHAVAGAQRGYAKSWQALTEGIGGDECGGGAVLHLLRHLELTASVH